MFLINGESYNTKEEVIRKNPAIASHNYFNIEIHAIEYGINLFVYLSEKVRHNPEFMEVKIHRLKLNYNFNGDFFMVFPFELSTGEICRKRLYLSEFLRYGGV